MYVKEWSRRRFLALMGGAGMIWLLDACTPKATEKPAGGQDDPLAALQPGQGIVLEQEGKKVAVYKTEAGELIRLSATCPHQGCTVNWNATDKRWDCPCHGSQFKPDGEKISGPAPTGLEKAG